METRSLHLLVRLELRPTECSGYGRLKILDGARRRAAGLYTLRAAWRTRSGAFAVTATTMPTTIRPMNERSIATTAPAATDWSDQFVGWELHPLKIGAFPRRTIGRWEDPLVVPSTLRCFSSGGADEQPFAGYGADEVLLVALEHQTQAPVSLGRLRRLSMEPVEPEGVAGYRP